MSHTTKTPTALASLAVLGLVASASAAPVATINDTTAGSATNDGAINTGEYVGSTTGIHTGFGDVIGETSTLSVDSGSDGSLNFGLSPTGSLNDTAVIYIDSVAGGLGDTTTIEDIADGGRAAISGDATDGSGGQSEVTFASNFAADYAITIQNTFSGLFQINGDGSLTFVASTNLTPGDTSNGDSTVDRELDLNLADLGISAGDSFNYFATYLNPGNAFRSNEFQGVQDQDGFADNVGANPVTLATDDFITFNSTAAVPEPASLALLGLGGLAMVARRRRTA